MKSASGCSVCLAPRRSFGNNCHQLEAHSQHLFCPPQSSLDLSFASIGAAESSFLTANLICELNLVGVARQCCRFRTVGEERRKTGSLKLPNEVQQDVLERLRDKEELWLFNRRQCFRALTVCRAKCLFQINKSMSPLS